MFTIFWLSFGLLQLPTLGLAASYSPNGDDAAAGAASVGYNAAIALYLVVLGGTLFTLFIFTLKTNVVMTLIIGLATVAIWILSAAYFKVSIGDYPTAMTLQHVCYSPLFLFSKFFSMTRSLTTQIMPQAGGGILFVVGLFGWYMTVVISFAEMGFPFNLPVGDLSHFWPQPKGDIEQDGKRD
jgi:uncharacterized protein